MLVRSFIVRIYQFDGKRDTVAGTILVPESDTLLTFRGIDELWDTLKTLVKQGYKEPEED